MMLRLALVTLLTGCAYTAEDFEEDYAEAWCDYQLTCDPPFEDTVEACRTELAEDPDFDTSCAFDDEAARACIDAFGGLTCQGSASNYPAACETVYVCG